MHGPIGPTIKREVQRPSTVITACSKQNEYSIKDSHDTLKYSKNMRDRYHLHIILISKLYLSWCIADSKASPHASPIFRRLASRTFSIIQRLFQRSAYLALASSGAQPLSSFSSWSLAWQKNYALPIDKRYMSTSGPLSLMRTLQRLVNTSDKAMCIVMLPIFTSEGMHPSDGIDSSPSMTSRKWVTTLMAIFR